jgi:hypothetical protein
VALALAATTAFAASPEPGAEIICPGTYGGHLQGLATDQANAIYWSFTVALVKTDLTGKILKQVEGPSHHGDLTCHDGKVYVAVNLGRFNQEPGLADSWVYVYDADDLSLLTKHEVPEVVHGAGGVVYHKGRFYVVGGLPKTHTTNYVYEYDKSFKFVKRHVIESGYTSVGIQTAAHFDGSFWFGCYEDKKGLLQTDDAFKLIGRHDPNYAIGIAPLSADKCLLGFTEGEKDAKLWRGWAKVRNPGKKPEKDTGGSESK